MNRQFLKRALIMALPTCAIAFGVMLALIACTGNLTSMAHSNDSQALQGQRVFTVNSHMRQTVILRGNAGMMHVAVGAPGRVTIKYAVRHTGAGRPATVSYSHNARANSITAREIDFPRVSSNSNDQVDFTVTVPVNTNLDFATSSGSIIATGTKGQVALVTHAGNVSVDHMLVEGNSVLSTQSGNVTLAGNVQIGSSCKIHTNAGTVSAFFPHSARLSISASLALGTVTSDFPSVSPSSRGAVGSIGHAPYGYVLIDVQVGTIAIHKI
ncbi:MAG TPA: DUF4097 family beta strand repeat-containing protein [Ktedonobacteraceae bacterium]|nr:DUF4097 family beta strand repeat-containing protein [Ktedonobacteraceae bacterium]